MEVCLLLCRLYLAFKMPANGLLITQSNIQDLTNDDILSFNSKEYWHKFILENGGLFDKELILQSVLDSISPFDLVPVKFTVDGKDAYFLARNCGQAIEKFCLNLLQPIPLRDNLGEVLMSIQTCSLPIDEYKMNMQFHLKKAIEKRFSGSSKNFIDLSSFHKESELYEVLFCPLSKPRFLVYVLSILKRILKITSINLSSNGIEMLKPLEFLQEFEGLVFLDISNNKIKDPGLSELLGKAIPTLEELNIKGNPVCNLFKTEMEYVRWIIDKNNLIRKLDGVFINNGFPNQQVYLCSDRVWVVVNQFLEHFFTLYDDNRQALEYTYEKNAIFSVHYDLVPSLNIEGSLLNCYDFKSKNSSKVKDVSEITHGFHQKNESIVKALWKLPLTEHDPYSFKVDVLFYEEPVIVVVVSGIFKDFDEVSKIRSFNRTFALKRVAQDEFKITNDLYYVTNATLDETKSSFLHSKKRKEKIKMLVTKDEEQNLIEAVSKLTEMNSAYSKRCLEDCNWDMKNALEVFLENYETFSIPPDAFSEELLP